MKTEPDVFSFDDLMSAPNRTACWEGVRNYQARNFMRDDMKIGDLVFFYHSNTLVPGIHGIAKVVSPAYADSFQWDPKSPYFDASAPKDGAPRWVMVDLQGQTKFISPVPLADLKADTALSGMPLLQKGMRLSVQPVAVEHWQRVLTHHVTKQTA